MRTRTTMWSAAVVTLAGLLLAGCGSGGSYGGGGSSSTPPAGAGTVATGRTDAGTVLVNGSRRTLYVFAADRRGHSACTGACLQYWPPVTVSGTPRHAAAVSAELGTLRRSDGATQLTVNGFPVYTYSGDTAPGQASGQGNNRFGGLWWAVSPSGASVKDTATTGGGRGGY